MTLFKQHFSGFPGYGISGIICGILSALIFTIIHDIFISNIWFSLTAMLISGAICGFCVAGSFYLLFQNPSIRLWWKYNFIFVLLFMVLGVLSVIFYEPVATVGELLVRNEPPRELITQAAPLTIVFIFVSSIVLGRFYGKKFVHYVMIFLTCSILILVLGLNVSLIGLVFFPSDTLYLVLETYALIILINLVYCGTFVIIQWKSLRT